MIRKIFITLVAALSFVATAVFAGQGEASLGDGSVRVQPSASPRVAAPLHLEGKEVIFNNIGNKYPLGAFMCCLGWSVNGSRSNGFFWEAMPFTAASDTIAKELILPVFANGGAPNRVVVSVLDDDGGLPGNAITSVLVDNLLDSGTCCEVRHVKVDVNLSAGKTYWVAVTTDGTHSPTEAIWNDNDTNQSGQASIAQSNDGSTWHLINGAIQPGLAVIGGANWTILERYRQ